ncbi:hypothetical protein GYMLUDRAFT_706761 [Collybiopsis luxurians FD-317 M1]|uniref:Uncharacterized protein n=1 Tax=Collybiopsis luxurians FD-317 M1 TaxID=944289 RepID=A0A0D0CIH2_9AGAR|nr:hypothetical protein GYMLUDRAFT_706761 [Collybiopsis luxurians FD-317 M1]
MDPNSGNEMELAVCHNSRIGHPGSLERTHWKSWNGEEEEHCSGDDQGHGAWGFSQVLGKKSAEWRGHSYNVYHGRFSHYHTENVAYIESNVSGLPSSPSIVDCTQSTHLLEGFLFYSSTTISKLEQQPQSHSVISKHRHLPFGLTFYAQS